MLIVRAAIKFSNGEVVEGHDYGHIITIANKLSMPGEKIYGFTTSSGEFILPDEAAVVALFAKQLPHDYFVDKELDLKPEDLWPVYELG